MGLGLSWLMEAEQKATCSVPARVRLCGFLTDPTRKAVRRLGQAREASIIFHSCPHLLRAKITGWFLGSSSIHGFFLA